MGRRERGGSEGAGDSVGREREDQPHLGGLDDTGGLGAVSPGSRPTESRQADSRSSAPRGDVDPGTYEDANITGTDVTSGMGRSPRGRTPGRPGRQSDDPQQQDDGDQESST